MKLFITTLITLLLLSFNSNAQLDTACNSIMGEMYLNECVTFAFNPYIHSGQIVERCFTFMPSTHAVNLGYIILNNTCGPIAPYTWLDYELYSPNCDTLIQSGEIVPNPTNTWIINLDTTVHYVFCVSWNARCDQFSICPLIYESPLPIELKSFTGKYNAVSDHILLEWVTASEINSSHFIIQKSIDGEKFVDSYIEPASGNSTTDISYRIIDSHPISPVTYYRMVEVDFDGTLNMYSTILVRCDLMSISNEEYYDVTGIKHDVPVIGINIVKVGNAVYKMIKVDNSNIYNK